MVKGNIVETTPAAVMELLIANGIYMYDNRNGKPFRDDLRELRDNGILNSIPFILEDDETIESVSLGANNAGSEFDLVTDRRIAEFKFINWKGNDTIRQNNTFVDFFNLVEFETIKRKCLYILDREIVIKFFGNNRALSSVLSKNRTVSDNFFKKYGKHYKTACLLPFVVPLEFICIHIRWVLKL